MAILAQVADNLVDNGLSGRDWIKAGVIVTAALVVAMTASRFTRHAIGTWVDSGFAAMVASRLLGYVVFLVGLFYALNSLGVQVGPLLGALGLGGLVLALALQKIVESFLAGILLQTRRPFTIGDTVTLDEITGIVVDIDSRTVVLRGLDGTVIRIPNGNVVSETIVNLTRNTSRRSTLAVGVAYDTDLQAATDALSAAIELVPRVHAEPAPMVVVSGFGASTIDFELLYWHTSDVPSEKLARHDLMLAIHRVFADRGISIAFPQVVVWQGSRADSPVYSDTPGRVETDHPASPKQSTEGERRKSTIRRLPRPWG